MTDSRCGITFTDYLTVRWLVLLQPEGEYFSDHFLIKIGPGGPDGLNVQTGRLVDEHTGEGAIYIIKKRGKGWRIESTGFWSQLNGRPRHVEASNLQKARKTEE